MKRLGAFFLILFIIAASAAGMWLYQSWRDEQGIFEKQEFVNVYIVKQKGEKLTLYSAEGKKFFSVKSDWKDQEYTGLADVRVRRNKVDKLVCKPEQLCEKVLSVGGAEIELENYGAIPLHETCGWFMAAGAEVTTASSESLYIGQTDARFVVAEGKICGVLLPEEAQPEEPEQKVSQIRVILKTDNFASYEHPEVRLRGTKKVYVREGKEEKEVQPGEELVFQPDAMKKKRVSVRSEEGGKIEVSSLNRGGGKPLYRGTIEIVKAEGALHLINDLPMEEYLYGVLPSEMPSEYNIEALKAQAICARSYAAKHIKNNRLKELGAHVDDSVSYQVYNNTREEQTCNQAVDETSGMKVYYDGKIASTYFFSTSCGATSSSFDVGFTGKQIPYLTGKLQEPELSDDSAREKAKLVADTFGNEELFEKFLKQDRNVLEKKEPWYRWSTTISREDIEKNINSKIGARCQAAGERIQVRQADGSYASEQVDSIGQLKRIRIKKRGSGGTVTMAVFVGSEKTVRVYTEYNIRTLLFNENAIVTKNDGTSVSGMGLLPSGFFVLSRSGSSYEIKGGGFGHGTGMSQTGANELAQAGKGFEEILNYYFDGVEIRS